MSRKDYTLIAGALRDARVEVTSNIPHFTMQQLEHGIAKQEAINAGLDRAALAIAHVLARENPRFNRDRFLAACKP